ncbi:right-handed parallel beta-helix repeat-containing protein [Dyadobacter sp. CY347]|uniref:right-handed parallel beta-helix repeat-containing protein n=1 Tax=Dyadobacter sp. CY347 TaxID=2909336 RepID=UPI001F18AFBF|nr:choice-of-anchor Q domain-containing protein [Dyadobacter sp. CY347]MCF2488679.1 T9SS type A sorting domain-containing protein [Dyadobacter sp. CY347]
MHSTLLPATSKNSLLFSSLQTSVIGLLFLLITGFSSGVFASTFYVKTTGTGNGSGSWANASNDLQATINAAIAGDEVWVAGGTFQPPAFTYFFMKEGVKIYGGFAGTETNLASRDLTITANTSVLRGVPSSVNTIRNSGNGLTTAALLDGFTVSGETSGIFNDNSSPMFVNVTITDNGLNGAGMRNENCSPVLVNCSIIRNSGVGMENVAASPILTNCTIVDNIPSGQTASGMRNSSNSSPQIRNSIIFGRLGIPNGVPGILDETGSSAVIRYSMVQRVNDENPDNHNASGAVDPLFVNVAEGDYRLQQCSPGVNKGNNGYYASGQTPNLTTITTDLAGNPRIYGQGTADMGAYEFQGATPVGVPGVWYVKAGGTGSGVSWECASGSVQLAINSAASGEQVWVAGGTFYPDQEQEINRRFIMKEGVKIYGGFAGTETNLTDRDLTITANKSILRGVQSSLYTINNNGNGLTTAALLDGFTVSGFNAGILNSGSSPMFVNVTITENGIYAPGMRNENSSPVLVNCSIVRNSGVGMENSAASPILTNCTIADNKLDENPAAGINNTNNSSSKIRNSIIFGNDFGIVNEAGSSSFIQYSLVQGEFSTSDGNIPGYNNPLFRNVTPRDYVLQACSPALNKGSNSYYANSQTPNLSAVLTDQNGNSRFYNDGVVDMGATEFQGNPGRPGVAGVWYVMAGATGAGKSWDCPMGDLQLAINTAKSGEQVWVAAGTYQPGSGPRFSMKEGVKIYGGFASTETSLDQRDLFVTANKSILNGDNGPGVLSNSGLTLTSAAVLDGFTINGSNGAPAIQNGSGSAPMLVNLTVTGNNFTGMYITDSSPVLINCTFSGNISNSPGGGMLIAGGSPRLINCLISNNSSNANGGGVFIDNSTASMINCTIAGNTASGQGGGIFNQGNVSPILYNSIVHGNNSGIYELGSRLDIQYSLVQKDPIPGGPATANIDPLFVNAADGNYRLQPCSPAVNAGFNYFSSGSTPDLSSVTTDLDNKSRLREHVVDLGAYEFSGTTRGLAIDLDEASANITRDYVLTSFNSDCRLVAYLNPSGVVNGTGAVSGPISAKVWVASSQPANFVKRHYQITPLDNAANESSKVTLFFTQQEFTDFNAVNSVKLPVDAADLEDNKANLRIEKRPGVSSDGSGLPNSYTGTISTFNPSEANGKVEWNADAQYWEVTFDVTGFSGFFVKTTESALPLNLISFTATKEIGSNLLQWSTTDEVNTDNFEIQRSGDAKSFIKIATVDAAGSGNNHYSYHDQNNFDGTIYYRLKMSDRATNDLDGKFTYSKIISLHGEGDLNAIYPNPAGETVTFQVSDALLKTSANLYDITGRHIQSLNITANKQQISVKSLPIGLYILKFADGTTERFVKK